MTEETRAAILGVLGAIRPVFAIVQAEDAEGVSEQPTAAFQALEHLFEALDLVRGPQPETDGPSA